MKGEFNIKFIKSLIVKTSRWIIIDIIMLLQQHNANLGNNKRSQSTEGLVPSFLKETSSTCNVGNLKRKT